MSYFAFLIVLPVAFFEALLQARNLSPVHATKH
jgi:hypothetical protein